jgi:adenylate cyclase
VGADFRLGPWLVEPSLNTVSRNGASVHLEPKVMEVLVCLAGHPGEAVPKEQLLKTVWPDTFVSDDVLIRSISELRRVFEDDAREPRIIQTIPKRGYRFIAPVDRSATDGQGASRASVKRDSIAVLPFVNMSPDPENEFLADGITEEIINALSQIEQLHVAARTSSFFFKGKHIDMRQIGEQLNVRAVVEGSVRKAGDYLRITAQLVNVADGYHLWSNRYDCEMKDVFAIQDEVARSIANRLTITLGERSRREPLVKTRTSNLEAYQLYLKGRAFLYQRGSAIARALECFKQAVSLDDEYALAWAGLADSYTVLGYYGLAHPAATMPKGIEAARRAVALDSTLAEAHSALAMACLMGTWDKVEAEREFVRALELNPRYTQARDWYALFYLQCCEGRLEEGVTQARLALESDPLSAYANALFGFICCIAGKHAEGMHACERAVEMDPESFLVRWSHHCALYFCRRFEDAVVVGEAALAMSGRHPWAMGTLAASLAELGKSSDADAIYAELMSRARRSYIPPSVLAVAAAAAGIQDEAIRHVREAFEIREPMSQFFLSKLGPANARLLADPRFQEMPVDMGWLLK